MDKGPWRVFDKGEQSVYLASDDFEHDVTLTVNGDFEDFQQRLAYCEWLAATLNAEGGMK